MGLGCDLALCCDFVVAGPSARFAMSYIRRGLFPDGGGVHFLPRRVGLAKAKELIFSGREVGPEEALALGIADQLAARTPMFDEVRAWAQQFVERSPIAIALAKSALNQTFERSLQDAFDSGAAAQAICYTSEEHQLAVQTFLVGRSSRDAARQDRAAPVEEGRERK
jgi:enoyl-CoA hydratase/carnithine racemase